MGLDLLDGDVVQDDDSGVEIQVDVYGDRVAAMVR